MEYEIYFFGCWEKRGHNLYDINGNTKRNAGPFNINEIDGKFTPSKYDETIITLVRREGWTLIAMHDTSIDKRPGSNVAFIIEEILEVYQVLQIAELKFPNIVKRLAAYKALSTK